MSEQEQKIQNSKNKDFGQIPHWVVDQGFLKILKGSEVKVYTALIRHADYLTGISRPTVERLIDETGCGDSVIAKATSRLASMKMIDKTRTGQRFGFRNVYKIIRDTDPERCIIPSKAGKSTGGRRGEDGRFATNNGIIPSNAGECNVNALPLETRVNAGAESNIVPEGLEQVPPNLTGYCYPSNTGKCIHSAKTGKKIDNRDIIIETKEEADFSDPVDNSGKGLIHFDPLEGGDVEIVKGSGERIIKPSVRMSTPAQEIVNYFARLYEAMTRQPFKHSKRDFCIVARLLKGCDPDVVIDKINILAAHCQKGEIWFARQGVADFRIGNLSAQWNCLIPQVRLTPEEIKDREFQEALKREKARDERFSQQIKC